MLNPAGLMGRHGGRPLPIIVVACILVWAWSGACGGAEGKPAMTASLVPNQTSVGGIVTLTLKFELPKGAHVAPEPEVSGLEGFQILDRHMAPENSGKKEAGECRMRLMVHRLASGEVGPVSLSYVTAEGAAAMVKAAPVPLTVLSNLGGKPEAASLKPIYGIIPTESVLMKYRFWILGGIVLLLLGVAGEWWLRKRRGKGAAVMDETPPDRLAIRGLKALDAQGLFEKGRIKDFYFGFSEILRRYLEALRGFPAAEYTLEEIARAAKKKEDQPLLGLLRRADMVKFADATVTPAAKSQDMETAFAYIRSTREPVLTEAASERRGGRTLEAHKPRTVQQGTPS
jgi:hypothetical protein